MPTKIELYREAVRPLLIAALDDAPQSTATATLAQYLIANSNLPGPRGNLELAHAFADEIAAACSERCTAVETVLRLLIERTLPVDFDGDPQSPLQMAPFCGMVALGEWGAGCGTLNAAVDRLMAGANSPLWRLREAVAMGLQRLLGHDWSGAVEALQRREGHATPLQWRAMVAGVAEPPLLRDPDHARDALTLHDRALAAFRALPAGARKSEDVRALRQALGYTVSVVAAAAPEAGFEHMLAWAAWQDVDVRWLLRENLKKKRLSAWPEAVARVRAAVP